MSQSDESVGLVQPGDDEFYLSCSAAANIAFAEFRSGNVAAEIPTGRAQRGGKTIARGRGGKGSSERHKVPQQFEREVLPVSEDSDSDAPEAVDL